MFLFILGLKVPLLKTTKRIYLLNLTERVLDPHLQTPVLSHPVHMIDLNSPGAPLVKMRKGLMMMMTMTMTKTMMETTVRLILEINRTTHAEHGARQIAH
jgi:hypothetical protein